MSSEQPIKMGDFFLLWGVILTMMGILGVIQMGFLEDLPGFMTYGLILIILGIILLIGVNLAKKSKSK